tara:strand:- start:3675 stop:3869 length:195 start_codon:yes stop_codon:yes gene_type:complete
MAINKQETLEDSNGRPYHRLASALSTSDARTALNKARTATSKVNAIIDILVEAGLINESDKPGD